MKLKKSYNISENLYNKIISVAYGEGSVIDKMKIFYLASRDEQIKKTHDDYRTIANAVHNLEEDLFPNELLKKVERKTVALKDSGGSFLNDFLSILITRPLVSTATTIVVVAAVVTTLVFNRVPETNYTNDEIIKADREARYALAIVNKIFTQTNSTLKEDVLTNKVSKPFNDSYNFINNLLEGEKR